MAEIVYILCGLTSVACTIMLFRGYRRSHSRFLLWSAICFFCLAVNNSLLFIDMTIVPGDDLSLFRNVLTLMGLMTLIYGLIWEAQ